MLGSEGFAFVHEVNYYHPHSPQESNHNRRRPEQDNGRFWSGSPHKSSQDNGQNDPTQHDPRAANGQAVSNRDTAKPMRQLYLGKMPLWKRSLDILGTVVGVILLGPLVLPIAIVIKVTSTGPVFFKQLRSGFAGKPFMMYKFRTMVDGAESRKADLMELNEQDGPAFKIAKDPRVTTVGRFLRGTSLDELPQLWNVLRGEMSLVGPRPLPCAESEACQGWQLRRLDATPGLTCLWQVKDRRSNVSFADWVRMDIRYIQSQSLLFDLKLILRTVAYVLGRRGC